MDNKSFYRDLKKQIKKQGNKKRRRQIKDMLEHGEYDSLTDDYYDYGHNESKAFNRLAGHNHK